VLRSQSSRACENPVTTRWPRATVRVVTVLPVVEFWHGTGYQRIQGELLKLGYQVSASTIRRVLKALKIPPASDRHTHTSWLRFLHTHSSTMLATDFFHVDCWTSAPRSRPDRQKDLKG
jgi:hypothetical protein